MNYHSKKERLNLQQSTQITCLPWQVIINGASTHNLPPHHSSLAHEQRSSKHSRHTETKPPGGQWVPGRKQCSWQSITERLPAFVLAPAQAQSAWSRSPEWAEAGLCWGGRGEGFERYIRKTEDPARLPTFRMSLSKDRRCSVFQRQFRKHTFLWNAPSSTPPPEPMNPAKTRQSNGSTKSKINLSFRIKI